MRRYRTGQRPKPATRKHPLLAFELHDDDAGTLVQVRHEMICADQIPCMGCGEHMMLDDAEQQRRGMYALSWCGRCRDRIDSIAVRDRI